MGDSQHTEKAPLIEITDLTGLSKPLIKLIEVVSNGVGAISKPYLIRKEADAKAYEITTITQAVKENQSGLQKIESDQGKLKVESLDAASLQEELRLDERAHHRIEHRELRKQQNVENITQQAFKQLESERMVSEDPVDEDWTTRFFDYAADISDEEMQLLWAKVLAGEVKQPKSYSLRTLEVLRNLSKGEAVIFLDFARLAIFDGSRAFLLSPPGGSPARVNFDKRYNTYHTHRLLMSELGILNSAESGYGLEQTLNSGFEIQFDFRKYRLIFKKLPDKPKTDFNVHTFTTVGFELCRLTDVDTDLGYIQLFCSYLKRDHGEFSYAKIVEESPDRKSVKLTPFKPVLLSDKEKERFRIIEENKKKKQSNSK